MINTSLLIQGALAPLAPGLAAYGYLRKKTVGAQANQGEPQQLPGLSTPVPNQSMVNQSTNTSNTKTVKASPQKPMIVPEASPIIGKEATVPVTDINVQGGEVPKPVSPIKTAEMQKGLQSQLDTAENDILTKAEAGYEDYRTKVDQIYTRLDEINNEADPTKRASYGQEQRILQNQLNVAEKASIDIATDLESNRKLTGELRTLMEENQRIVDTAAGSPVAMSVLRSIEGRTIQDVQARAGVLSAVMTATTQNIDAARLVIKDAGDTVKSHWKDRVDFIESVKKLKLDRGLKILDADEKELNVQLSIAKGKMDRVEKSVEKIQELMVDPKTAKLIANAGITLNDDLATINKKMSKEVEKTEIEERRKTIVDNATNNALKNGAPASVIAQLKDAKDWADVAKYAGPYIDKYERAKMQSEIAKNNASIRSSLLEQAEKGDPQAIKTLGFDPNKVKSFASTEKLYSTNKESYDAITRAVTNSSGLSASSGLTTGWGSVVGRFVGGGGFLSGNPLTPLADKTSFMNDVKQIYSSEGLKEIAEQKARGVNLTPLSDGDRDMLVSAAGRLNSMVTIDSATGEAKFHNNTNEKDVKDALAGLQVEYKKLIDATNIQTATASELDEFAKMGIITTTK